VTRGRLPQKAVLPGLNGGGAAAVVPPLALQHLLSLTWNLPECSSDFAENCEMCIEATDSLKIHEIVLC